MILKILITLILAVVLWCIGVVPKLCIGPVVLGIIVYGLAEWKERRAKS